MASQEIARVLVYGDLHLSSKNYGAHFDYPKDSLGSLKIVTSEAEKFQPTHIIGLGDLTYGRFNRLEYRAAVEQELSRQFEICEGRRYELKGNHDTASYGMTEYEYYVKKGLLKPTPSEPIKVGDLRFTLVDYGKGKSTAISHEKETVDIVLVHEYFKFSDTKTFNLGEATILDNFEQWFGVDIIIGGHIHDSLAFSGVMNKGGKAKSVLVDYVGSMSRPSFIAGRTEEVGHLVEITVYSDGTYKYDRLNIQLPSIAETFNVVGKEKKVKNTLDISDIVDSLDKHERKVGNPEDIIQALQGIDERYKKKAIELLKAGMA